MSDKTKKKSCPLKSKAHFLTEALPLSLECAGQSTMATSPREFSKGSVGYFVSGKVNLTIDGIQVPVQIGANVVVIGSKDLPETHEEVAPEAPEAPAEA